MVNSDQLVVYDGQLVVHDGNRSWLLMVQKG